MTFPARRLADLDLCPFPNDVVRKRADAPAVAKVSGRCVKRPALFGSAGETGEEQHRCVKDDFTGRDPVGFGLQSGTMSTVIPEDNRILLAEPIPITARLVVRSVLGITLVDGPYRTVDNSLRPRCAWGYGPDRPAALPGLPVPPHPTSLGLSVSKRCSISAPDLPC